MDTPHLCKSFNLSDERALELIRIFAATPFEQFLKGQVSSGTLLSAFMNIDALTSNEKCFLTAHTAIATQIAVEQAKRKMMMAEFMMGGGFP